jgi:hypothetical protein
MMGRRRGIGSARAGVVEIQDGYHSVRGGERARIYSLRTHEWDTGRRGPGDQMKRVGASRNSAESEMCIT